MPLIFCAQMSLFVSKKNFCTPKGCVFFYHFAKNAAVKGDVVL